MMNFILYKFGQFLAMILPFRLAYRLAIIASDIHYLFADVDRANVTANLKAIFPEKSDGEIARLRLSMSRNFTKYLADFFKFGQMDKTFIEKYVTFKNARYIDEALAGKRGVVILTAHTGNWELGGVVLAHYGYDLWVVALEHQSKLVNAFFDGQRKGKGVHVIPFNRAVRQSIRILAENRLLALLGDRDFTREGGIVVPFFGKPTSIPKGPAALALRTGAPIVPGFLIRNPDDTFTLVMEPPIDPYPGQEKPPVRNGRFSAISEKELRELTLRCTTVIERYVKQYPDQWYMYRKFWVEDK
ncbi:MAG: lysophospholipid acyltransferase family protein [Candidatus Omnitrophica bacterium]|nr:lysophospholipid acyltransferase family protein [Candidatus Omnitrophota bacterium]